MWSASLGVPVFATPTVLPASDVLVVAGFHSRCFGLSLEDGAEIFDRALPKPWHAAHGGSASHRDPYASPVATRDGNAVVCCAERVICLGPEGKTLWEQEIGHGIKVSPTALHDTDEIAVCPVDGLLRFLDAETGTSTGELFLGAKATGSPAVSGNILAIGTQQGEVFGVDIRTRKVRWRSPQGAPRSYTSLTVLPSGDFVAVADRGNVVCLRRDDGRFLWETSQVLGLPDHDPAMDTTPVVSPDGRMFCGSYTGVVYEFRFQPDTEEGDTCRWN